MPEAPRDRHCARSFSTVASTASMLGQGRLGSWMGESWRKGSHSARQAVVKCHKPALANYPLTCPASVLEARQPLLWPRPALPSAGNACCLGMVAQETGRGPSCNPRCAGAS